MKNKLRVNIIYELIVIISLNKSKIVKLNNFFNKNITVIKKGKIYILYIRMKNPND